MADRKVDPVLAANFLVEKEKVDLIADALETYFRNGGARIIAGYKGDVNKQALLAAAMPVVSRANPKLHRKIIDAYYSEGG